MGSGAYITLFLSRGHSKGFLVTSLRFTEYLSLKHFSNIACGMHVDWDLFRLSHRCVPFFQFQFLPCLPVLPGDQIGFVFCSSIVPVAYRWTNTFATSFSYKMLDVGVGRPVLGQSLTLDTMPSYYQFSYRVQMDDMGACDAPGPSPSPGQQGRRR